MPVLAHVAVQQALAPTRLILPGRTPRRRAGQEMSQTHVRGAPVVDDAGRFIGTVALDAVEQSKNGTEPIESIADPSAPTVGSSGEPRHGSRGLAYRVSDTGSRCLTTERRVIGTISTSDVVRGYRLGLLASLRGWTDRPIPLAQMTSRWGPILDWRIARSKDWTFRPPSSSPPSSGTGTS